MTRLKRRLFLLAPLLGAAFGGAGFWAMLRRMRDGAFDPHDIPNPLVGHPVPDFTLPPLPGAPGFSSADLRHPPQPMLVNFFASWCIPCVEEMNSLMQLRQDGIPIWGIVYKDKPDAVADFLRRAGNPYARIVQDPTGRTAIDWGVTGVPETYLIDRTGTVRTRITGAVQPEHLRRLLKVWA